MDDMPTRPDLSNSMSYSSDASGLSSASEYSSAPPTHRELFVLGSASATSGMMGVLDRGLWLPDLLCDRSLRAMSVCCVDKRSEAYVSAGSPTKRKRDAPPISDPLILDPLILDLSIPDPPPLYTLCNADLASKPDSLEIVQKMEALMISQQLPDQIPHKCNWVSADKLVECACKHVAAIAKAMIHLVIFQTSDQTGDLQVEKMLSASAFMICGKRKLALTAKHNVDGVHKLGQGGIYAYTQPQKACPDGGQYFAKVVGFIGKGHGMAAVLQLRTLSSDPAANERHHAVRLAEVPAKQGDKIRVVGIANVKGGDDTIRVLALDPGTVASPGDAGYRKDGLVPCDLTMFQGLSGGAMTTQDGCVVALAEGVDSHSGRMAFATDLVGSRQELENLLRSKYKCGIGDLETDAPESWAFSDIQEQKLHSIVHKEMDERERFAKATAEAERGNKAVENADILKTRIKARVLKARKDFTGRTWLANKLRHAICNQEARKVILITGTAGTGKSYFFDRLLDTDTCSKLKGDWAKLNSWVLVGHCCMFEYSDSMETSNFLQSLIGQLLRAVQATGRDFVLDDKHKTPVGKMLCDHLLPDESRRPKHKDPLAIVTEVLKPALNAIGSAEALGGKCVILVDSLDEARSSGKLVAVLVKLVQESPDWLRIVATSRPDAGVTKDLKAVAGMSVELNLNGENQEADVRQYVETLLPESAKEQVSAICKKAKGVFKYAAIAVRKLTDNPKMDLKSLPDTLEEMYMTFFERKYPDDKLGQFDEYTAPTLSILVASRQAVPLDLLIGDTKERTKLFLLRDSIAFVQYSLCDGKLLGEESEVIELGHKTFVDFVQSTKAGRFMVHVGHGHALLAERCRRKLKQQTEPTELCMQYTLKHLLHHLCYLHEHRLGGASGLDPLHEAARTVLNFDWLFGRVMMDKATKGVLAECTKVAELLKARNSGGDAELLASVEVIKEMTGEATWTTWAVFRDPRQFLGRLVLRLRDCHEAPLIELARRAKECKRCNWWMFSGDMCEQVGNGDEALSSVGHTAFRDCGGITAVNLPRGVTSIGPVAFKHCRNINAVKLPEGLTSIARSSFDGCDGITTLVLPSTLTRIGKEAFFDCRKITSLTLPNGIKSISTSVFSNCAHIAELKLPESLTRIGDSAFKGCKAITTLALPKSLTSIGYEAFAGCAGITTLNLPKQLSKIGDKAFRCCDGITSLTLPEELVFIGESAFFGCSSITAVSLPRGLTHIGGLAFFNCGSITALSLPESLLFIGKKAFQGCDKLTTHNIQVDDSEPVIKLFLDSFDPPDPLLQRFDTTNKEQCCIS